MQVTIQDQEKLRLNFIDHMQSAYPGIPLKPEMVAAHMFSPFQITLPQKVLQQVQNFVQTLFGARRSEAWNQHYSPALTASGLSDPGNFGILMSYDFHLDEHQQPKLIEINTNASFLGLGYEFYQSLGRSGCHPDFSLKQLMQDIQTEKQLFDQKQQRSFTPVKDLCIVDESPPQQKLYAEFLLYQALFQKQGVTCHITDVSDTAVMQKTDFIYNRHTDFYLKEDKSQWLQDCFSQGKICMSPNPHEYFMLADKKRLEEWTHPSRDFFPQIPDWQTAVQPLLLESQDLNPETMTTIWDKRKKIFFKPRNSFGAKQSYRGATISRNTFETLAAQNIIAQEFCPAPVIQEQTEKGTQEFKYDLRFYAYQNKVQFCIARIYQGQVTNMRTELGGFAPVKFH